MTGLLVKDDLLELRQLRPPAASLEAHHPGWTLMFT
jgi:hypothetical protein